MEKKVIKNYFYNVMYLILNTILPIITTPYLSRVLGAEGIGIYGYTISIVTYFMIFGCLGITNYGQRKIAAVQDDKEKRSKVFWELLLFRIMTSSLVIFAYIIAFCIKGTYSLYYRILLLELVSSTFDISYFFQGIEEFKKITIRNLVIRAVSIILIFALIRDSKDLWLYVLIYSLSIFLGNVSLWIDLKKYIIPVKIKLKDLYKHIKPTIAFFLPQIATSIYTVLDRTMIGVLYENISEVGFYEQSQKIIKISLTFVSAMSTVMVPSIAKNFVNKNDEKMQKDMKSSFSFMWLLSIPIVFGLISISSTFVPWFFGHEFLNVSGLLALSSIVIVFISVSTLLGTQYLMTIGKIGIHTTAVSVGALLNLITNLLFIEKYGAYGAVVATLIAEFSIALVEIIYIVKKKHLSLSTIFPKASLQALFGGIIMSIVLFEIQKHMAVSWSSTLIQVLIGILTYGAVMLLLKNEFVVSIFYKKRSSKNEKSEN